MKKQNEFSMREAMQYFIKEMGMEQKVLDSMVIDAWEELMGAFLEKHTQQLYVKNRTLHVRITQPALKSELSYGKSKIVANINEILGQDYLLDVRFL